MSDGTHLGEGRRQIEGRIFKMVIDNVAKRNSFTADMMLQLSEAMTEFDKCDELWVAVLCADGEHFTAGIDMPKFFGPGASATPATEDSVDPFALRNRSIKHSPHPFSSFRPMGDAGHRRPRADGRRSGAGDLRVRRHRDVPCGKSWEVLAAGADIDRLDSAGKFWPQEPPHKYEVAEMGDRPVQASGKCFTAGGDNVRKAKEPYLACV